MENKQQDAAVAQQLIDRHFEIWNDTNPARRAAQYPALYTSDIFLADYAGASVGYVNIGQKIDEVQGKHAGFTFSPQPVTWNHGIGRVTWGYGPANDPDRVRGEDIFTIEDGKIASLHVFIDKAAKVKLWNPRHPGN